jgi:hypothetical protein
MGFPSTINHFFPPGCDYKEGFSVCQEKFIKNNVNLLRGYLDIAKGYT